MHRCNLGQMQVFTLKPFMPKTGKQKRQKSKSNKNRRMKPWHASRAETAAERNKSGFVGGTWPQHSTWGALLEDVSGAPFPKTEIEKNRQKRSDAHSDAGNSLFCKMHCGPAGQPWDSPEDWPLPPSKPLSQFFIEIILL